MKSLLVAALAPLIATAAARAQCLDWQPGFGLPGMDGVSASVDVLTVFDDGNGAALYAGGYFTGAGGIAVNSIARWNGSGWSPLGNGVSGLTSPPQASQVKSLCAFDDGSGPALYAGGFFTQAGTGPANDIARWDGSNWSALGSGVSHSNPSYIPGVYALAVFDDGGGPALFAGGYFTHAGGVAASNVAKWNGSAWTNVGGGLGAATDSVRALAVFDDGTGPALYAGGYFFGAPLDGIAKWDGSAWTPVGTGTFGPVFAMSAFDDGGGTKLFAAGRFDSAGGVAAKNIASWDGQAWSPLAGGIDNAEVYSLTVFDDGNGRHLHAGGSFNTTGGAPGNFIARWNGAGWSQLGGGANQNVNALAVFDDGEGAALYAGGFLTFVGGLPARKIARWRNSAWSRVGEGDGIDDPAINNPPISIIDFAVFNDGHGSALYAGGEFRTAGVTPANNIARWDGSSWSALGLGVNNVVAALAVFDDGGGPDLYVGGYIIQAGGAPNYHHVVRWDGSSWSGVGSGVDFTVNDLVVFDDGHGPALYAGGAFDFAGGAPASCVAKWNGSSWSPLGSGMGGFGGSKNGPFVVALAAFDDGGGPALYAAGYFASAGGVPAYYIAKWNGSSWSALGSGIGPQTGSTMVKALGVFHDGTGPALYVGGSFSSAGGVAVNGIARWDGETWSAVGTGVNGEINALRVFDDGSEPALYASGRFTSAGGLAAANIARWNGSSWTPLSGGIGTGASGQGVSTLAIFDDGSGGGPDLYAGGHFERAGGVESRNIAAWRGCSGPGTLLCFGDGVAAACPCANSGAQGHGCRNSASAEGARLNSTGTISPDTVVLQASGELPTALTIFLQGSISLSQPAPFGDGLRCAGGSLKRLYVKSASGGAVSAPQAGDLSITARSAALGDTIPPGHRRYYQTYYRDSNPNFCPLPTGNTFNATNGVKIVW